MEIQDFSRHLDGLGKELRRQLERDLPEKIGNLAVRLFKRNFQEESFFGRKWKEVKRRLHGAKGAAGIRKILTGPTGNLGRSIQYTPHRGSVTVHSDLPYAEAHNEGTTTAGRGRHTTIPQRRFMGEDKQLTDAIEQLITKEISKALNK